jgi:tetratricopeptide (TPR) repeat protein
LGYDPDWENDQYDKSTGISRYYNFDTVTFLQSFVYAFEGFSSVNERINIHSHSTDVIPSRSFEMDSVIDNYDDNSEWKAHKMLNSAVDTLDHHQSHHILKAVKKCFELFDFTNAMVLSQKAQKKLGSFLSNEEKAILLHIEGLCAHNRHFFTQGNMPLANHLHQTFEKALRYEVNPSRRIALLYRLIVTTSRRKNDFKAASLYAIQAFEELKSFSGDNKELLLAWINNVYSYMLMKEGDLTGAIQKHEEAYYLLDEKVVDGLNISLNEVNYTKAILAENLSTLNSLRGDFDKMQDWYKIETFYTDMWPSLNAVSSAEWQSFYYQQLKITQALSNAKQGLKKAKQSFNYILEYFFTLSLADIYNRLGKANEAMTYYRKCLVFHKRIGRSYDQISFFALQMALIKLSVKSKHYEEALQLIEELDHTPGATSSYESIEILEQAAICHIYVDQVGEVEKCINRAIEIAVTDGDCNLLFKTNLIAGQVCQLLKRTEDAKNSYLQAQEISKIATDGVAFKPSAPDMATLYLGLLESGKINTRLLAELIKSLSDSLKKNIDCWWNLKKVLRLISLLPVSERKSITETPFCKKIFKAASQRMDCPTFYENYSTVYTEI